MKSVWGSEKQTCAFYCKVYSVVTVPVAVPCGWMLIV